MSDPRLTPDPAQATGADPGRIIASVADLMRRPGGPRDRQLIHGDAVTVLGQSGHWRYVQSGKDGYCGYLHQDTIGPALTATHWVSAPATHAYEAANIQSPDKVSLTFGSRISVLAETDGFAETDLGFVPRQHLRPMGAHFDDPAAVAALFLGTPYLWGGNSRWGIDCSGLVQAALLACGIPCPGDSDMQTGLGHAANDGYRRNDLLFWKGHVGLVADPETLIHANAHAMSTAFEPIAEAINRIKTQGDGEITAHRRLSVERHGS